MAKKILVAYNFNGNELQNVRMHSVAGDPGSPVNAQVWYDSSAHLIKWRANGATINPLARANHSGTQTAATISDFDTQVRLSRLDQMAVPTADLNINSRKLTSVADGTATNDAVNFGQLSAVLNGRTFKDAVRAATTGNITLSGAQTIDGVSVVAGDRVLVMAQTTASQNGIYVAAAGAWARAADADNVSPDTELRAGSTVLVAEGTANGDKQFTLTTNGPITIGTTALSWATSGSGTTYTEGTGIDIVGSVINIDTAVVVRKFAADVGDNSATSIAVNHNLNTEDIQVEVYDKTTKETVECDVDRTSVNQVTLLFAVAPTAAQYRVVVFA